MVFETESYQQLKSNLSLDDSNFVNLIEDAIAKIQIKPDFTIVHPDYEPLTVSKSYRDYLAQRSVKECDRYLVNKLQQYLYAIFCGRLKPKSSIENSQNLSTDGHSLQNKIVNDTNSWHKTKFFTRLTQCNHSKGYKDAGWLVVDGDKQHWQVSKDGLTINIDLQEHFLDPNTKLQIGDMVSLVMPPNLIERGFYIAVGNAGSANNLQPALECAIEQLYFNVDAQTSLMLLDGLTRQLNERSIPFDFKIPYSENDFERIDAPVLEFLSGDLPKVKTIVKNIHSKNAANFQFKTPFFCQQLAPGLGLARKPRSASNIKWENYGYKHCSLIAQSILRLR